MVSVRVETATGENVFSSGIEEVSIDPKKGVAYSSEAVSGQRRLHSRYMRQDISVWMNYKSGFFSKYIELVELINISHYGAAICCSEKLRERSRVSLSLIFESNTEEFILNGRVVNRRAHNDKQIVGIKFDKVNRSFEEYLLKSGLKIKLRRNFE